MTSDDQIKLLRKSTSEWNAWRTSNTNSRPDLHNADLSCADLANANLRGVVLRKAILKGAKCTNADLRGAVLFKANLEGAVFDKADLTGVELSRAALEGVSFADACLDNSTIVSVDLRRANFIRARMRKAVIRRVRVHGSNFADAHFAKSTISDARFMGSVMRNADFTGVRLSKVHFSDVDLSDARGLETIKHFGPSTLDKGTRTRSGQLSLKFLFDMGQDEKVVVTHARKAVHIAFKRELWAQLVPLEHALAAALGDKFSISKQSDAITVMLADPDLIQVALDAVLPVLAGIEAAVPGEIIKVATELKGLDPNILEAARLHDQLAYLIERFDEEMPPERLRLTGRQQAVVGLVENGFRGVVASWLKRWFEAPEDAPPKRFVRQTYSRFKRFLFAAKEISDMPTLVAHCDQGEAAPHLPAENGETKE